MRFSGRLYASELRSLDDLLTEQHAVVRMHLSALSGETRSGRLQAFHRTWHVVTTPKYTGHKVAGVNMAALVVSTAPTLSLLEGE